MSFYVFKISRHCVLPTVVPRLGQTAINRRSYRLLTSGPFIARPRLPCRSGLNKSERLLPWHWSARRSFLGSRSLCTVTTKVSHHAGPNEQVDDNESDPDEEKIVERLEGAWDPIIPDPNQKQDDGKVVLSQARDMLVNFQIPESEIREQFQRGHGPGGQKVNKTSNCVVLTHLPTGITVRCHESRSQAKNRELARKILRTRVAESLFGVDPGEQAKVGKIRKRKADRKRQADKKKENVEALIRQGQKFSHPLNST